jgi:hypothetical protein
MDDLFKQCLDFEFFAKNYIKVVHPIDGLVNFEMHPYKDRIITAYAKNNYTIVKKFRQAGISSLTLAWSLWKCIFDIDQSILWLMKTDRDCRESSYILKKMIANLPDWLMPILEKDNEHEKYFLDTNSRIKFCTPTSINSSFKHLIIDEAAFVRDMANCWKAIYPRVSTKAIVISTPNGRGNWFEQTYMDALDHKNDFKIVDINYLEHPEYRKPEWSKKMKELLGMRGWTQEVLASFE